MFLCFILKFIYGTWTNNRIPLILAVIPVIALTLFTFIGILQINENSFLIIIFVLLLNSKSFAENVSIQAKNITLDKNSQISIFENDVIVTTEEGNEFKCNYVEYNRQTGILKLK